MIFYHLYLGLDDPNPADLPELISVYFPSFTLQKATGYFRGSSEHTTIIGIGSTEEDRVWELAESLRTHYDQEGVGIVRIGTYERCTELPPA